MEGNLVFSDIMHGFIVLPECFFSTAQMLYVLESQLVDPEMAFI